LDPARADAHAGSIQQLQKTLRRIAQLQRRVVRLSGRFRKLYREIYGEAAPDQAAESAAADHSTTLAIIKS
jgi:hypothetical protein